MLTFTNQSGITGIFNAGIGALTLSGTATLAQYRTALRTITYSHSGDAPTTPKTVEFVASDTGGAGPAATRAIAVTAVADAPTAAADSFDAIGNTGLFVGTTRPGQPGGQGDHRLGAGQ